MLRNKKSMQKGSDTEHTYKSFQKRISFSSLANSAKSSILDQPNNLAITIDLERYKGSFKQLKHVGQTLSNSFGCNMFDPFEQHNQTCWIVLNDVG